MSDTIQITSSLSSVWDRPWELFAGRGEGAYIWDTDGTRYLDFTSGVGVTNTGHCHPRVVEEIRRQVGMFIHAQANLFYHQPMLRLAAALLEVVPSPLDTFFFSNSGAEAVEASLKLARQATERTNVIAFERGFHGRTVGTMSLTSSKTVYRAKYQPLMAGVFFAPFAYCYRCPKAEAAPDQYDHEHCCNWPLDQMRHILKTQTAPEETAAILVEPVLGEGGYVVPPPNFLRGLREVCDEHGIILILDEVQSGFGRTGKFFAFEHFDVIPDILVMGKGLASGLPLSGIVASNALMDKWPVNTHGGTYGGNAVACAAAEATLRVIQDEGLLENAQQMGEKLMGRLRQLQEICPIIGDVRGLGLMVGTEFVQQGTREPAGNLTRAIQKACFKRKLLLMRCGTDGNVIRWLPPLIIGDGELDEALEVFEEALEEVVA